VSPSNFCCLTRCSRCTVEHAPDFGSELLGPIRLADKLDASVEAAIMDDGILGIAGSKQSFQSRDDFGGDSAPWNAPA
jgi:hypothetical protein